MVVLLSASSGSLDAISFLALGAAFASVMTGNIVFMGVAVGTSNATLALSCGVAILGYAGGVSLGSWLCARWARSEPPGLWPSAVTKVLTIQFVMLALGGVAWLLIDAEPDDAQQHLLLVGVAAAMGLQGAAVRRIGVPVSTTYMTGALTTMLEAVATRRSFSTTERAATRGLLALAVGALLGSLVLKIAPPFAMFVPATGVGVVISGWLYWRGRRPRSGRDAGASD